VAAGLIAFTYAAAARTQVAAPAPETLAVGDWQLEPVVEARVRGEYRHDLDGVDKGVLVERSRLGVDVTRATVEGRVVLQDARVWDVGVANDLVTGPAPLAVTGIYEAWAEAHTAGAHPSSLRVGRQEVLWGEGRLLGVSDWSPTGRALDAVRARYVAGNWAFEVLAAILEDPATLLATPAGSSVAVVAPAYGELFGARIEWAVDPLFVVEAYALARIAQTNPQASLDSSVRGQTYTPSLRLHGDGHGWTWGAEGAFQLGHADGVTSIGRLGAPPTYGAARSAWAAAAHLDHVFDEGILTPAVRLGASCAGGDHGGTTFRAFDPLLPDAHVWYGAMDLLTWSNELEANARLSVVPWTDAVAALEYRYARLAQPGGAWTTGYLEQLVTVPGNTRAELGHEIDAKVSWSPAVPLELEAGYSMFVLGDGARAILTASSWSAPGLSHYAYLQATLRLP
jgi:hypothetical protein